MSKNLTIDYPPANKKGALGTFYNTIKFTYYASIQNLTNYTNQHKKVIYTELFGVNEFEPGNGRNHGSHSKLSSEEIASPQSSQRAIASASDTGRT